MIWLCQRFRHQTGWEGADEWESPRRRATRLNCKTFVFEFSTGVAHLFRRYRQPLRFPLSGFPFSPADWQATISLRTHLKRSVDTTDDHLPIFPIGENDALDWLIKNLKGKVKFTAVLDRNDVAGLVNDAAYAVLAFTDTRDEAAFQLFFDGGEVFID
jgi:hypothetical protein